MTYALQSPLLIPSVRKKAGTPMRVLFLAALLSSAVMPLAHAADGDAAAPKTTGTTATVDTSKAPKPPSVTVISAKKREIVETLIVSGSFVPREEILVVPEVDGMAVLEILAEEGDVVKKGQVLAKLSASSVEVQLAQNAASLTRSDASISQAQASIAEAEASLSDSSNSLERTKALRRNGVSTVEQLDQRQAGFNAATARLNVSKQLLAIAQADKKATEAQRDELNLRMARTDIKAPADGLISRRSIRIGGIASMSQDAMFRIIADGDIELNAEVTESDVPSLKVGQPVQISIGGVKDNLAGTIRLISSEVNTLTRLGAVRIALPKGSRVATGTFGRGIIEIARTTGVTLPMTAVTFQRDGTIAQVVHDGKVSVQKVKTGLIGDGNVQIIDGVKDGDFVVARAGTFVRDGDVITPVEAKAEVK
jgi:HlyD family secretion protein